MCQRCDELDKIEDAIMEAGGGKRGIIIVAAEAIIRGLKLDPQPLKTHDTVVKSEFQDGFTQNALRLRDKEVDIVEFLNESRRMLESGISRAYVMGMWSVNPKAIASDYDFDRIQRMVREQLGYASKFAYDIHTEGGTMSYERRAIMYTGALDAAFNAGVLSRLKESVLLYWTLHPAEHCVDCIEMEKNSPYTPEQLGDRTPRSGHTRCHSNCKCTLEVSTKTRSAVRRFIKQIAGSSAK